MIHQELGITLFCLTNLCVDTLLQGCMIIVDSKLHILSKKLEKLSEIRTDNKKIKENIKECVELHNWINESIKKCENMLNIPMCIQYCISFVIICFTGFYLSVS